MMTCYYASSASNAHLMIDLYLDIAFLIKIGDISQLHRADPDAFVATLTQIGLGHYQIFHVALSRYFLQNLDRADITISLLWVETNSLIKVII